VIPISPADGRIFDAVSRLWALALDKPAADPGRSFFALGGDSLLAMQLCARLSLELGVPVPVRLLFEAPQLEDFCARLRELELDEGAILDSRLSENPSPELSFSQERMCFMHEIALGSAAYHVPMAWYLTGKLDVRALSTAFARVVANHEVLTMTVVADGDQLKPLYGSAPAPELTQISLTARKDEERERQLEEFLCEFANGPFHLDRGPLVRAALVQMTVTSAVLVVVMHHVVTDQWSLDVFFRELAAAYGTGMSLQDSPPVGSRGKFAAYASAHRKWFSRHRRSVELAYWREKLRGLEPTVLHEDFVRPAQQSFVGAKLRLDFGLREILALRQLGAAHNASLAMVLLTALKVLLHRHVGSSDIAVGVPVANRQHLDAEGVIGTLTNTLVLRTDLEGRPDFALVLSRVRANMLEAFENQDLPFDLLVRDLDLQRDASRPPLFSVMFNMLNTPLGDVQFPGLGWRRLEFDKKASQFDLTVTIDAHHARSISFEYSTALFAPESIQRLADHYMELLRAALRNAAYRIDSVVLSPESEQRQLHEWARGPRRRRAGGAIPALFESQFDRSASNIAIRCAEVVLTYDELHRQVLQVSRELTGLGIGRGSLVGLHLVRSPRIPVAILGVLYSGAAYVPLDPSYPSDRLAYMARDAGLNLLLTDEVHPSDLPWPEACRVLAWHALSGTAGGHDFHTLPDGAGPADPAYVIYTSGSTGEPKGVVVPHGSVCNVLRSMQDRPGFGSGDRLLAVTTLSFDIAVLELLLPLTVGGQVVMATQSEQGDGDALKALLEEQRITVMQATPSTWQLMIDSGWGGTGGLRAWVGGETLSRELADQLLGRCTEVWNMYGPTETTVWSTCGRVEPQGRDRISLGRPIANTEILVLDENRELCPVGVPGEICIGGDGVASGYLHRPELTATRFFANPHSRDRRTARIYNTGDRGRWRQDGQLEHLGRLDSQVKIRGYRIELGEIESRLRSHPAIESAVVLTQPGAKSGPLLLAWLVPRAGMPGARELREHLRQWLPDYMLPQHLIEIPSVPLLPNGKLDRRALPAPSPQPGDHREHVAPRDAIERALWDIWRQTLQISNFGIHDNLFELGGHSLLAVRIVGRLRTELQRQCNLSVLFRNPTIASLAVALSRAEPLTGSTLVPLQVAGEGPEIFCLCGIMIYRELAEQLAPRVPVCGVFVPQEMAFLAEGMSDGASTPDVPELAREYLNAIRSRQPKGPYRLAGFSFGGVLAYEVAQQLRAAGESVSFLAILDSDVPGREKGGMFRNMVRGTRQMLQTRFAPDSMSVQRDVRRYTETMRRYNARPYPGEAIFVRSAEKPTHDPGYGWETLISNLQTLQIHDSHPGILRGKSAKQLAGFLLENL
jgi:amino acid adenylation domain-containing protein